jgi:HSP20 family molecular chaperone IbpA
VLRARTPIAKPGACARDAKDRLPASPAPANRAPQKQRGPLREYVALHDLTACLLEAYDCVSRRAHEMYVERGRGPGGETDDWLAAQRELLSSLPTNVKESGDFVYALASVPGAAVTEVAVGVESHWLVILVGSNCMVHSTAHSFCVLELPTNVDPERSVAILSDGMLAIRMKKLSAKA